MGGEQVGAIYYDARIETKKLSADANKAERIVSDSGDKIETSGKRAFSGFSTAAKVGLAAVSAAVVASTVVWSKHLIEVGSELQSMRASFESMTGSAESATKVMSELNKFSFETAFSTAEINAAARTLLGAGASVEQLGGYMQWLGDVAGATGADLGRLTLPISQAMARGKLQTQDFYQILDSGAGALGKALREKLAERGMGDFMKAMEEGKVSSDLLFETLREVTQQGGFAFQGAIKQANTFQGRVSNLKETIDGIGLAIIGVDKATGTVQEGGFFDRLSDSILWLQQNIGPVVENIKAAIGSVAEVIKPLTDYIANNRQMWEVLKTSLIAIGVIIGVLVIAVGVAIVAAFAVLGAAIQAAIWVVTKVIQAIQWLGNALADVIWNVYQFGAAVVRTIGDVIGWFARLPGEVVKALGNMGNLLFNSGRALIDGFIGGIRSAIGAVKKAVDDVMKAARDFFPFSPAKDGPFSGRGYTSYSGAALMKDFAAGMMSQQSYVANSATSALAGAHGAFSGSVMSPTIGTAEGSQNGSYGEISNNIGTINIASDVDADRLLRKLTGDAEATSNGLVPLQAYGAAA